MKTATPIFVLGIQRSGTTWLANALGSHPDVAAVEAEDHQGVHESIFFSHFAKAYGDLSADQNFQRFADDFTACDYFLLSRVSEEWFKSRRPAGYPEAFQALMDEMARRDGASFWVEKSPHHTLLSWELAEAFPGARFICVVRDPVALIRSRLWAFGRVPPRFPARTFTLLRACAAVSLYQRHLADFCSRSPRALLVSHEQMSADLAGAMRLVADFVGAGFSEAMLEQRFRPNTSFSSGEKKARALGSWDRAVIRAVSKALGWVPLTWLRRIEERRRRRKGVEWPSWCWKRRPRHGGATEDHAIAQASNT